MVDKLVAGFEDYLMPMATQLKDRMVRPEAAGKWHTYNLVDVLRWTDSDRVITFALLPFALPQGPLHACQPGVGLCHLMPRYGLAAQVPVLVGVIAERTHDRQAYALALQPLLAACDARLHGFATRKADAFNRALDVLRESAKGLRSTTSAPGSAADASAAPFLRSRAAQASAKGCGAAATLYVLMAVSACAGACSAGDAAALRDALSAARKCSIFAAAAQQHLSAAFAAACASSCRCVCEQAVLAALLAGGLQSTGGSACDDEMSPQRLTVNRAVQVATVRNKAGDRPVGETYAALVDVDRMLPWSGVRTRIKHGAAGVPSHKRDCSGFPCRLLLFRCGKPAHVLLSVSPSCFQTFHELCVCCVTASFNELSLFHTLAQLPFSDWGSRVKRAVSGDTRFVCERFTGLASNSSGHRETKLACDDKGGNALLLAVLAVFRPVRS
jgi:hypothetical protein